jgi:predicted DNA-binding protein
MQYRISEKVITCRMPDPIYERLRELARSRACNMSTVVRQLILEEIGRRGLAVKDPSRAAQS